MKITTETKLTKRALKIVKILKIVNATEIIIKEEDLPANEGGSMRPLSEGVYEIIINSNMSANAQLRTLAHEMIHVRQFDCGDLRMTITQVGIHEVVKKFWKNKEVCLYSTDYMQLPWEKEAFAEMNMIAQLARK